MEGWISLHRQLLNKSYFKNAKYLQLWIYLLLSANHKSRMIMWNGKDIKVERGQLITGREAISKGTKIRETTIENILDYLEKTQHQIRQEKHSKYRVITILNYDKYQKSDIKSDTTPTTGGQQVDTNNKDNNVISNTIPPLEGKNMKYQDTHHSDSHEPSVEIGTPLFSPLKKKDMTAAINLEEEITTLSSSKDPADRLVAYYWKVKGISIPTIYSMKRQYGRDIVYARELVGFDTKIIFNAFKEAKKDSEENHYDWKISTVAKKITSLKHD